MTFCRVLVSKSCMNHCKALENDLKLAENNTFGDRILTSDSAFDGDFYELSRKNYLGNIVSHFSREIVHEPPKNDANS